MRKTIKITVRNVSLIDPFSKRDKAGPNSFPGLSVSCIVLTIAI